MPNRSAVASIDRPRGRREVNDLNVEIASIAFLASLECTSRGHRVISASDGPLPSLPTATPQPRVLALYRRHMRRRRERVLFVKVFRTQPRSDLLACLRQVDTDVSGVKKADRGEENQSFHVRVLTWLAGAAWRRAMSSPRADRTRAGCWSCRRPGNR